MSSRLYITNKFANQWTVELEYFLIQSPNLFNKDAYVTKKCDVSTAYGYGSISLDSQEKDSSIE